MKSTMIRTTVLGFAALGLLSANSAFAHEPRVVGGDCNVEVGWGAEPALEDGDNSAVVIISDCGGNAVAAADINLSIRALRLASESFNASILNQTTPIAATATDGLASIQLTPTINGPYGFIINGTIAGRPVNNVKFVCGAGSQAAEAFDCVVNPRVFPSGFSKYQNN